MNGAARPFWLTIPQTALALKVSTAEVRKLIRKGALAVVDIDAFDVHLVSRDSVEAVKQQRSRQGSDGYA